MALSFLPQTIIRRKRDSHSLSEAEIAFMVQGIANNSISESQIAAFAMAVYFQGLDKTERVALTRAMTKSGTMLDWSQANLHGPTLDKHSTGGVGDKVSLILAPLIAACGGYVPMISGRGLGHTGGTLDKLDSIPGYNTTPDLATLRRVVTNVGCAIVGQTDDLAPADRHLYAIRDVTATVDSLGLIVASILSKKLAAGLQGLILDVKVGSGAFMTSLEQAQELASELAQVANAAGLPTQSIISDMNQVLGDTAGNALEVQEAVDFVTGKHRNSRLQELIFVLGGELLLMGQLAANHEDAHNKLAQALANGSTAEKLATMITALGGPADFIDNSSGYLPSAPVQIPLLASQSGYISNMDTRAIGLAIIELGAGRQQPEDKIDYRVGLSQVGQIGDVITASQPLAIIHAASDTTAQAALKNLQTAIEISKNPSYLKSIIY